MSQQTIDLQFHSEFSAIEDRWRQLQADNGISVHQSYDWCHEWRREGHQRLVVEGRVDGQTHCILPLERHYAGPLRVGRFVGSSFSNLNTGVFSEMMRDTPTMARDFLHQLRIEGRNHLDILVLEQTALSWRGKAHPFSTLLPAVSAEPSFQLQLVPSFLETLKQLSATRRLKKHRASHRKLVELGGYEHVIAVEPEDAIALLDVFFTQKAERFDMQGLPDVFRADDIQASFRRLASHQGKDGDYLLQMHALRLKGAYDGCILALGGLSRKGDHVICQFGSIDSLLAPHTSPGDFLFHLIIQRLCEENVAVFDLGVGDQSYKRAWCNIETPQHDLLFPITFEGLIYSRIYPARQALKRAVKRNPNLYRLIQRVRSKIQKRSYGG